MISQAGKFCCRSIICSRSRILNASALTVKLKSRPKEPENLRISSRRFLCKNLYRNYSTISIPNNAVEIKSAAEKSNEATSFKKPSVFIDDDTAKVLSAEENSELKDADEPKSSLRTRSSSSRLEKERMNQMCYEEVLKILNGEVDYRVPDLETLLNALRRAIKLGKTKFVIYYFDGWWKLFQESSSQLTEPPPETIVCEMYSRLGHLNRQTNGLLRVFMNNERVQYLQLLALKGFPTFSSRALCFVCESLQHMFLTDDLIHPWDFLSPQFVNGLFANLQLKKQKSRDFLLETIDIPYQTARIAAILAKLHARVTDDQRTFFCDDCIKLCMQRNAEIVDYVNKDDFISLSNAHSACAVATLYWRMAENGDEEFWLLWFKGFENILSIYDTSVTIKQVTESFAAQKPTEEDNELSPQREYTTIAFRTIIAQLCTTALFAAVRTNNMALFQNVKTIWAHSLRNCVEMISFVCAQRVLNEVEAAESMLLHSQAYEGAETRLIDDDLRQKLRQKADEAKDRRIGPIIDDFERQKFGRTKKRMDRLDESRDNYVKKRATTDDHTDFGHGFSTVPIYRQQQQSAESTAVADQRKSRNQYPQKQRSYDENAYSTDESESMENIGKNRYQRRRREYYKDLNQIPNEEQLKFKEMDDSKIANAEYTSQGVPRIINRRRSMPPRFQNSSNDISNAEDDFYAEDADWSVGHQSERAGDRSESSREFAQRVSRNSMRHDSRLEFVPFMQRGSREFDESRDMNNDGSREFTQRGSHNSTRHDSRREFMPRQSRDFIQRGSPRDFDESRDLEDDGGGSRDLEFKRETRRMSKSRAAGAESRDDSQLRGDFDSMENEQEDTDDFGSLARKKWSTRGSKRKNNPQKSSNSDSAGQNFKDEEFL